MTGKLPLGSFLFYNFLQKGDLHFLRFCVQYYVGDIMSQDNRNYRSTSSQSRDPYDRGFAHKLYEDSIGPEPTYRGERSAPPVNRPKPSRPAPKKGMSFMGKVFTFLVICFLLFATGYVVLRAYLQPPMGNSEGRLSGCATILIAGTDESGLNTDTLMLLNVDRREEQISIMSIPRDTRVNSTYVPHKINGAYAANGSGTDGMFWLCDYVRQCIGFKPDAYILVDLDCFVELVELFGGVEFYVPMDMHYEDPAQDLYIHLEEGMQTLDGQGAMGVVRFRKGYTMQDIDRVKVQRDFIMAALSQWKTPKNALLAPKAIDILNDYCLTDLSTSNLLWLAESLLVCGTDDMMMTTIPHYLGTEYVYIQEDQAYLELINRYFNPYEDPIGFEDLMIVKQGG